MRSFTLLAVLFFTSIIYSQDFKGYYINNAGQRIDVFFKKSFFTDPSSLEYRASASDEYKKLNPGDIIEYGIGSEFKIIKGSVEIDNTISISDRKLSIQRNPQWEKRVIFLNVLLDGDAALYSYIDNGETKFFYTVKGKVTEPVQLINRKYIIGNSVHTDAAFRKDLYTNIKCDGDEVNDFLKVSYNKNDLITVFSKYNECNRSTYKIYTNKGGSESSIEFSIFAGINYSSFHLEHNGKSDSESTVTPGFGAEAALIFPSGKWAVFARLDLEVIKAKVSETINPGFQLITEEYTLDAKYLNLVAGPRYFFTSRLYADVAAGVHLGFGDLFYQKFIEAGGTQSVSDLKSYSLAMNFFATAGAGYKVTDNWAIELRYDLPRGILSKEIGPDLTTQRFGGVIKYTFN